MLNYNLARSFIYKNARPLDKARWDFLFEDGNSKAVLDILQVYQNQDGGFGHGLEADSWNNNSTPLQTWMATRIIKEVGLEDNNHPLIKGILKYLCSKDEFTNGKWHGLSNVKSNDDYPHAPWWSYNKDSEVSYNPTASLIGFILKYEDNDSDFYSFTKELLKDAFKYFKNNYPIDSMHETACFVELYDYLKDLNNHIIDIEEFKKLLAKQIKDVIEDNIELWDKEYVCHPSLFIQDKNSDFYLDNKEICKYECDFIGQCQNSDGSFNITWAWDNYSEQWAISKNWWKCDLIIKNIKYIKEIKR